MAFAVGKILSYFATRGSLSFPKFVALFFLIVLSSCKPAIENLEPEATASPTNTAIIPSSTNQQWIEASPSNRPNVTATWTPSQSLLAVSQKIQFYTGDNCQTSSGAAISLFDASVSSYNFTGVNGLTYTYKITSESLQGSVTISECSNPLRIEIGAPNQPASVNCPATAIAASLNNTCTLTNASPEDPIGLPVTYHDSGSTCLNTVVNSSSGAAAFTAPIKAQNCVIKIKAYNGASYSAATSSQVITGTNRAPNDPASLTCATFPAANSIGNTCTLVSASPADPDGDTVSYFDDGSTCAVSVSVLTGNVTFAAPLKGATCLIKVKSFDGDLYSNAVTSATITGANNAPNTPSSLACNTSPSAQSTGNVCSLSAAGVLDLDGDAITYSDGGSTCSSVVVNSVTGEATFTAPTKGNSCLVKVRTFDGTTYSSAVSSATITAINNSPATPASLTCSTSPFAGSTGNACTLVSAATPDADGDSVSYFDDGSTCSSVVVNSTTGNATFTAPTKGVSCQVKVRSFDGNLYSASVTSATITAINNAPATPASIACVTTPAAGSTGNICSTTSAAPADPDGDSITYYDDASSCPDTVVNVATGGVTFTAPAKGATCVIKIKSFDGVLYSSAQSSASISGTNNSPNSPASISCATSPLGQSLNNACTLTAAGTVDPDGDSVSYADGGSTCATVVINSGTGNATFTAPTKGASCLIKVKTYDGTTYSSVVSSASITGANNNPTTPTALSCATTPLAGSTNNACTLSAAATPDLDGDAVTYFDNASSCPSTVVNSSTGAVSFTAPASGASCAIHVRAFDGSAYSVQVSSTINGTNNAPNTPSTLSCVTSPLAGSTGNTCSLTAASPTDSDGDSVSYVDGGSTCASTVINSATGDATFTSPAKGVNCLVKVKAFDGALYSGIITSASITGSNNSPNAPAAFSCATTPIAGSTNNACTLTAASPVDADGDAVTYADGGSTCSSVVINSSTGNATFTAPANGITCLVKVKAFDSIAYSTIVSSATITGTNNAPNTPASLSCLTTPVAGSTNNACTLTAASPVDPEGDSVSYVDGGSTCTGISISAVTGDATFTAPAKGATCLVKIKSYDGINYSGIVSSATITGANNAPNTPTTLNCTTTPAGGSTGVGCTLTAASPADPDGDTVSYVDGGSTCSSVVINGTTGNATFTAPAKSASCLVKIKSFDGTNYSSVVSSATITGSNNAPNTPTTLACATTPVAGSTNNACSLTAASPADTDGDAVTYSDGGSTCSAVVINSSTGDATFTAPAKSATCLVKVRAHDGTTYGSAVSSATITGSNNAPTTPTTLSCVTNPSGGSTGNACTLTAASPVDPDGDSVSYADGGSTCASVSISALTGNATFTAPAKGASCLVKVKSYDGATYSGIVSSATITGVNNTPNTPSSLSCTTNPLAASTGNTCTLTAGTADPDGDSVTYSDGGSTCSSVVVNATTGNATYTAPAKGATCLVLVKAYDGVAYGSAVSSATITGANNSPTTPPTLSCVTNPAGGSTGIACTLTAASPADVDGDSVSYYNNGSTCASATVSALTGNTTFTAPAKGSSCLVKVRSYDGAAYSGTVSSATITGANNAPNTPTSLSCATTPLANSAGNACTLTAASPADPDSESVTYSNNGSTCSTVVVNATTGNATFTAPAAGATCLVKVRAYDNTAYGATVTSATITGTAAAAPSAPTGVAASGGPTQVSVSWNAVAGATSYNIYWKTSSGVTTANGTKITGATTPYVHSSLVASTTYYYIVTAVNGSGEGTASSEVSATAQAANSTFYALDGTWDYSESWGDDIFGETHEEVIAKKTLNLRQGTLSFSAEYDWEANPAGPADYYVEVWIGGVLKLRQAFTGAPGSYATPHSFTYNIGAGDVGLKEVKIAVHSVDIGGGWASATIHSASVPINVEYTVPGTYSFVVPAGVTSINLEVSGALGGNSSAGGTYGDKVKGTLAVTPGQTYTIIVAGKGEDAWADEIECGAGWGGSGNPGGSNGGGSGSSSGGADRYGAGGGGRSTITLSSTPATIIAGASGGTGGDGWDEGGGSGGGPTTHTGLTGVTITSASSSDGRVIISW